VDGDDRRPRRAGAGRIVAVASSADTRELALAHGADVAVDAGEADLTGALVEAAGGRLDVVLEMAGGATTDASLEALAPFGRLVVYGMASRQAPTPIAPGALMARSRGVVGFWLAHALRDPARHMVAPFAELSDLVTSGALTCVIGGTYALSDVRRAHEDLRARRTVGKLLLDPSR
jgi:NADPH2:quinone reductase